jgi:hypothetical protein
MTTTATLGDVQDEEVNYYVLVPFSTVDACEWFIGYVAESFDCHIVSRTSVDQNAFLMGQAS